MARMSRFPLTFLVPKQTKHLSPRLVFFIVASLRLCGGGENPVMSWSIYIQKEKSRVNEITNKQVEVREH